MREQVNSLPDEMKKLVVQEYLEGVSSSNVEI
jgi:DNA-directed RNA polymerase specialized sigma24 family protein